MTRRELIALLAGAAGLPLAARAQQARTARIGLLSPFSPSAAAPWHEAVAALLPCYWIYWEVGKELERSGSPDPLYARWIGTYAAQEFGDVVRAVIDATDRVAGRLSPAERAAMKRHFVATSRYEWMFWEMGHRREAWPV